MLLFEACQNLEAFTPVQRKNAGIAARRLLKFAWNQVTRDNRLVIQALQSVCRTFESDPTKSAILIRRCLEQSHLAQYGFEEMLRLSREVAYLIPFDPELVKEMNRHQ